MRDYAELIKDLRESAEWSDRLAVLMGRDVGDSKAPLMRKAAGAIEELLAKVPTWISVEDELPEENKQIISYLAYKGMAVLQYENKHFYMQGAFQPLPKEAVTHWMPLPAPPKGVE